MLSRWTLVLACALLASAAIVLGSAPVRAVQPEDVGGLADQLQPMGPEGIYRAAARGVELLDEETLGRLNLELGRFGRSTNSRWQAQSWNPLTHTPQLVVGTGLSMGRVILDERTAEEVAREFVDLTRTLWGLGSEDLVLWRVAHGLQKWSVHFHQQVAGWPVIGSRLTVTMTETGRVAAFGGDLWPQLRGAAPLTISAADAPRVVHAQLAARGLAPAAAGPHDHVRVEMSGYLPLSASEGRPVHRVMRNYRDPLGAYLVDLDAQTGELLQLQNVLRMVEFTGTITADIDDPGWCAGIFERPVANMDVVVAGVGAGVTAPDGSYQIPFSGSEAESLFVEFLGPFFDVNNFVAPDSRVAAHVMPGAPFDLHWDDANSRADERDVFYHGNVMHDLIKSVDPGWADLDFPLPANVNLQQICNAYWDGSSINFYREGGNCANTGTLGDVIAHEYAHGITDFMYGAVEPSRMIHEANSDVAANFLSGMSVIGQGFYLDDCIGGIRDTDNDQVYPDSLTGEPYHDSTILSGFHWHARENLVAVLGEEAGVAHALAIWHWARALGLPHTQPQQVWWTFVADDDDGNIDNGTPHWAEICAAAEHKGHACPELFSDVVIHHAAYPYGEAPLGQALELSARIYSLVDEIDPATITLYYRNQGEGEFHAMPMLPTGEEMEFGAEVAGLIPDTYFEYYIYAADMSLNELTDPREAPEEVHTALIVPVYEPFEDAPDWTVGAAGDDATQGIWEWCDPVQVVLSRVIQPEDDVTPDPGRHCWITGQYYGGYAFESDADGTTSLTSPPYDLSGYDYASLECWLWFQTISSAEGVVKILASNNGSSYRTIYTVSGVQEQSTWKPVEVDLSAFFPTLGTLRIRVVMYGQPLPSVDEAGLDELVIRAGVDDLSDVPHGSDASGLPASLAVLARNPMVAGGRFHLALPRSGPVEVAISDINGRLVRRMQYETLEAGVRAIPWDGRDSRGSRLESGVYFCRATTPGESAIGRLVLMR